MFDYKQRPFVKSLTDSQYDRATGRLAAALPESSTDHVEYDSCGYPHRVKHSSTPSPTVAAALEILSQPTEAICQKRGRKTPPPSKRSR